MEKLLYFDYCASAIMLIMLAAILFRRLFRGKANMGFLFLLLVTLFSVISDIWAVSLDNMGTGNRIAKYIAHDSYLILHNLTIAIFDFYLVAITDTWHKLSNNRSLKLLMPIPFFVVFFSTIISNWTGWIYYLDETDTYTRGKYFFVLYGAVLVYIAYAFYHTIKYTAYLEREKRISLLVIYPFMLSSTIIQILMPNVLIELFAISLALLLIMLMIQRPEERIDASTGIYKLVAYESDMKRTFRNNKKVQIIMVSVANYRALQDVVGYESTRQIIKRISDGFMRLKRQIKLSAEFYYMGNGRFRVVIDENSFGKTEEAAEKINWVMNSNVSMQNVGISMQTYVCIVKCPDDLNDFDTLIAFGSQLEKQEFTASVVHAEDIIKNKQYNLIKEMDAILEDALIKNKFEVYYQPIYSVSNQQFNSAEALLRLKDEKYGFISPEVFIPVAEKNGSIHRIGAFVFEEVCKFIASEEFASLKIKYIEVNLSTIQCMQEGLANDILDTMKKYHVKPRQINLEITETATSYSQRVMYANINQLTDAGIEFSLDDFGTGYSNMKRIASLPLSIVKFDKTFADVGDSTKLKIILENMVKMVKDMDMKIVVEGVENEKLVRFFSDLKCEYIQGYYYSKPIPRNEFVEFVRANNA
ncbi:MAG: EAL domain-containing protein [Clostridium sp.]|nr:EAL domain-containing protein [Clostridium sp.]MCM1397849.1 EAL domain-containing protein [Clostridium sp.]MCM1459089.1 EAL domain-containing protein [Bacteroides sp.]